ncbi:unnamed protein product [Schistosoma curassoni]|uniref:EF-hand domain-containing protein n=1 Tax=Schistosoma curassoni TaxID=6186 RepID=A0A183JLB5_9TREM|nr:unnamed protein product [Schistosoma curassoni]
MRWTTLQSCACMTADRHIPSENRSQKDCPSGLLNRSTFLSMYTQFFPDGKARLFYEHLFRTFDQDASGSIDFNEFLTVSRLIN